MTAAKVTGRGSARPGRLARSLRGAGLSGAALSGAGAAGALVSLRAAYPRPPRAVPPEGWPPPVPVPQGRLAVAVMLGASGSVITDALGPYEVFARSPEFFVYTVSAGPAAMLSGGLAVAPGYSLGDVDAGTVPGPNVVVIPAVVSPAGSKERPLREWRPAGPAGARTCSACAPGHGCWLPRAAAMPGRGQPWWPAGGLSRMCRRRGRSRRMRPPGR